MERIDGEDFKGLIKIFLPFVLFVKYLAWLVVILILTFLSLYEFRSWFLITDTVTLPVFFTFEKLPDLDRLPLGQPLRKAAFLQANFSLVDRHNFELLLIPQAYQIEIDLIVPDYEVNFQEGMFLTCLKFTDRKNSVAWPSGLETGAELTDPMKKYGQCRSLILIKQNLVKELLERLWNMPWYFWSSENWPNTHQIAASMDENFEIDVKKKATKGTITLLSRNLQVVSASITFSPQTSRLARYPFISAAVMFLCFFVFWFLVLCFVSMS